MEILGKVLLIIAGIASMFILISLVYTFLQLKIYPEKIEIRGEKSYVINLLVRHIYDCFEMNVGKRESIICSYVTISSTKDIYSSDIINKLDPTKIEKSRVIASDLGSSGEVVIRYENQNVYVEKVEHERISS